MTIKEQALEYLKSASLDDLRYLYSSISREARPQRKAFLKQLIDAKQFGGDDALAKILDTRKESDLPSLIGREFKSQSKDGTNESLPIPENVKPERLKVEPDGFTGSTRNDQGGEMFNHKAQPPTQTDPRMTWGYPDDQVPEDIREFRRAFKESNKKGGKGGSTSKKSVDRTSIDPAIGIPESMTTEGRRESINSLSPFDGISDELKQYVKAGNDGFINRYSQNEEDPTYLANRERLNNFLNDFKGVLGPLTGVVDMITSQRDVRRSQGLADRSMRNQPSAPSVRGENRILSNLIRESQIAAANPMQQIRPFQDQINLGYQQDLSQAQAMSGGQAGVAMGLGQAAAIRRGQSSAELGRMAGDMYNQGIERTAALVGQQMQDDTWRDQQNIDIYRIRDTRNIQEQQAAGEALAASRTRALQSRNNFLDNLLDSPVFDLDSYINFIKGSVSSPVGAFNPGNENITQPTQTANSITQRQADINKSIQDKANLSAISGMRKLNSTLPNRY